MELDRLKILHLGIKGTTEVILFFVVHSFAMSSVVTNPVLYGWLNTNLKHLFRAMIPYVKSERNNEQEMSRALTEGAGRLTFFIDIIVL